MDNMSNKIVNYITFKVEPVVRSDDYNRMNNTFNEGYKYTVKDTDAARAMVFIEELLRECQLTSARVYPVKIESVLQSSISTEQEIIDEIVREAVKLGTITKENISKIKK